MCLTEDCTPAPAHSLAEQIHSRKSAKQVDARLQHIGPHHGAHAAVVSVNESKRTKDENRHRHYILLWNSGSQYESNWDGRGEDTH